MMISVHYKLLYFQRPCTELNVVSGFLRFCPLSQLTEAEGFVKDDAIFIQAQVDKPEEVVIIISSTRGYIAMVTHQHGGTLLW